MKTISGGFTEESLTLQARFKAIQMRATAASEAVEEADYVRLEVETTVLRRHIEELDAEMLDYREAHGLRVGA